MMMDRSVPSSTYDRLATRAVVLAILCALLFVYGRVLKHNFVALQDGEYIFENQTVLSGLTWEGMRYAFAGGHGGNWHPVTTLSHMLDCQWFGDEPGDHLAVNVLLHAANSLLLFAVLRGMTGQLWPSAFVAALFALHPLNVESVAWASQRKVVLGTLFWILALGTYAGYVRRPSLARYGLVTLCLAVSLAANPLLVALPFVFLALDFWPLHRFDRLPAKSAGAKPNGNHRSSSRVFSLVREKTPWFALAAVPAYLMILTQGKSGAVTSFARLPLLTRLASGAVTYFVYLLEMVWPSRLSCAYPHPALVQENAQTLLTTGALAGVFLVALTAAAIRLANHRPYLLAGWFWYVVMLIPVMGFFQINAEPMADRYTYVPLVGIFMIVAWSGCDLMNAHRRWLPLVFVATGIILITCAVLTYRQVGVWQDSRTLYDHALAVTADNYRMRIHYASLLEKEGRLAEAIEQLEKAGEIRPHEYATYAHLGLVFKQLGEPALAVEQLRQSLELGNDDYAIHGHLGELLFVQKDFDGAAEQFRQVVARKPDYADGYFSLALALMGQGDSESAERALREAIRLNPDYVNAHGHLGDLLAARNDWTGAVHHYQQIVRVAPQHVAAHFRLAQIFEQAGGRAESAEHFRRILELDPQHRAAREGLQRPTRRMDRGSP